MMASQKIYEIQIIRLYSCKLRPHHEYMAKEIKNFIHMVRISHESKLPKILDNGGTS